MTEFIRLPSRILNLSQIQEIGFEGCSTIIHWHNGETSSLPDIDAAILLDTLERRYGLLTDECARWWEELEDSNHRSASHSPVMSDLPSSHVTQ